MNQLCRFSSLFVLAGVTCFASAQIKLRSDEADKDKQLAKFHRRERTGTPAALRLKSYEDRVKLDRSSPFQNLEWKSVGPEYQGGRVVSIAAPENDPRQVFVAYATGGLWKTTDEGQTWTPLFDKESTCGIGDLAVSKDGKTIWIGSGEANSSRTSYAGTGVFKSVDGGETWTNMGLNESHHIGKILIDPNDSNTVYAAVLGHLYTANPERGVYKTTDGGKTWTQVLKVNRTTGAIDLTFSGKRLFAHLWDRQRTAWDFAESGPGSGLFYTDNGGTNWSKAAGLPGGSILGRGGLATSASNPNRLYLTLDNQDEDEENAFEDEADGILTPSRLVRLSPAQFANLATGVLKPFFSKYFDGADPVAWQKDIREGKKTLADLVDEIKKVSPKAFALKKIFDEVYRSEDGGKTWSKAHAAGIGPEYGYYFNKIFVNPRNPDDVVLANFLLHRSTDGGRTWTQMAETAHVDFHAVYFDPKDPNRVIVGSDGGVYFSANGGKSFRVTNNIPVGQTTTLALDNQSPYHIYTGLQDNGTMEGPSNYVPGESDPNDWKVVGFGDGSAVAVDAKGIVLHVAYQFGGHSAKDRKSGESWGSAPRASKGITLRFNWISPLILSSFHPDIVYCGSQFLHRSFNQGKTYETLSGDLTKGLPYGNVIFGTLKDISESPLRFGQLLVGADDGSVAYTPDGGATWIPTPTPTPDKWVTRVISSKHNLGTFYVAQNGYRDDDFTPYLWKSTDFGKTWISIAGNLPLEPINVVREDPSDPKVLYVGTDLGVYGTRSGGNSWFSLNANLPHVAVHDLQIQPKAKHLVAATHGRSVWVFDLSQLTDLTPEILAKPIHLFAVASQSRKGWGLKTREAYEPDTEERKLPIRFTVLSAGTTTVELLDKDSKVVLSKTLSATNGLNKVELDLKLAKGKAIPADLKRDPSAPLKDLLEPFRAKFLAAGSYTIRVRQGDKVETQTWELKAD